MALTHFALQLLAPHLRDASVLCFGYPDVLATPDEASAICGAYVSAVTPFTVKHKLLAGSPLVDTRAVFAALNTRAVYVDSFPSRGVERCVDLNVPLPDDIAHEWDLVIDAGTIEHCANVGQALLSAAQSVRVGGRVFHSPPVSMLNHGFYNICPTLLCDFYEQNGFVVEHISAFYPRTLVGFPISRQSRAPMPPEAALYFLARRETLKPLVWPNQSKYTG